ncbi:MAG: competence/damage-inducible protein A [Cyclobacteriaceae bacterium]|nr:competence/damage-inducible protein A [Cyclobacteriaceae bacterium]
MRTYAEIITIGDEILYGQTLDTNSHWISGQLDAINIHVRQKTTIGDDKDQILATLAAAEKRADVILITGGLGPTRDDLTKPLLAQYFGVGLKTNDEALTEIAQLFATAGKEMTELNLQQADLPENCIKITNQMGTAPGMWFEERNKVFIAMPGVPYEMKAMMEASILPRLQKKFNTASIYHRIIKTIGIPESKLAHLISDWESALPAPIRLAYLPSPGQVKLRLTSSGNDPETLKLAIQKETERLLPIAGKYIYGYDDDEIEAVIGKRLLAHKHTLATAESCTGGYLSSLLTRVPGSSAYFKGSVIAYSNEIKQNELGVPATTLESFGAVSEQVVIAMAEGIRKKYGTDTALATSGIAGPGGGTEEKPVGTVWIAYSDAHRTVARKLQFSTDRQLNITLGALAALNLFRLNYLGE